MLVLNKYGHRMNSNYKSWKITKNIKSTEYTITGLKPSTGYYVYVRKYKENIKSAPVQNYQPFYTTG